MSEWQERAIRVAYFLRIPNVGDTINPSLVTAITGRGVAHAAGENEPHLLAVGSVMASATAWSHVWGTGVMHPDLGAGSVCPGNVYALRGRLTYSAMKRSGIAIGDVPLGDPAYLAPRLLGIERAMAPKFRAGLVCHYVDRSHPVLRRMMRESGVADLNVHESPDVFLARMAECETVLSTSLHGLVLAEALGIPSVWIEAGDEVAGGGFKFRDWFSTTRQAKASCHVLRTRDTAAALAGKAECHESAIDPEALIAAFPLHRLEELSLPPHRRTLAPRECRTRPIPVFLISFNRGATLKRAIAGIRRLATPTEIVIHDNGSRSPRTAAVLEELEASGIQVFRYPPIHSGDELNSVDETVQRYFAEWGEPGRYVVSDCDVDMSVADPQVLDVYDELLNRYRHAGCVGPMLRIRDVPRSYPLFNRVMNRQIQQFWQHVPAVTQTSFGEVAVLETWIDTTFALHRAGEAYRRLKSGLRIYEPFEALHLDWYGSEADEDAGDYAGSASPSISHWSNREELTRYRNAELEYPSFYAARRTAAGTVEIYQEQLMPGAPRPSVAPQAGLSFFAAAAERLRGIVHTAALRARRAGKIGR